MWSNSNAKTTITSPAGSSSSMTTFDAVKLIFLNLLNVDTNVGVLKPPEKHNPGALYETC